MLLKLYIWMHTGKFLCHKFKEAVQGVRDSQYAFDWLCETADNDTLVKWEAEAAAAQDDWIENPSAMDIYEVQLTKGLWQYNNHWLHTHGEWESTDKETTRVAPVEPSGEMAGQWDP
jgi:hypothetical protein